MPLLSACRFASAQAYVLVFFRSKVENICEVRTMSFSVTTPVMHCLVRKWILDDSFIRTFLLLALSSSWADDNMLADIIGRGVKGDASLYSFPVIQAVFYVAKSQPSFAWHPSSLCSHWWLRLHRCVLCAVEDHRVFVFNVMQPPPGYQTMQHGSF